MSCQNSLSKCSEINNNSYPVKQRLLPTKEELWDIFAHSSVAADLAKTEHGGKNRVNPYHEEGNVFIHTKMVFAEMEKYCQQKEITGETEVVCLLLAIAHDFGKFDARFIKTDELGNEKTVFYNHPSYSVHRFIDFCQETGLTMNLISKGWYYSLIQAIYFHDQALDVFDYQGDSFPSKIMEKWQKILTYNPKLSLLLPAICHSDNMGRITNFPRKKTNTINIFETLNTFLQDKNLLSEEDPFFEQTCNSVTDFSRKLKEKSPIILLATGLQGSGKSTIFQEVKQSIGDDLEIVSFDQFVEQLAMENKKTYIQLFEETFSKKYNWLNEASLLHDKYLEQRFKSKNPPKILVLDRTHATAKSRNQSLTKIENLVKNLKKQNHSLPDYHTACFTVFTSLDKCLERNQRRKNKNIGKEVVLAKARDFIPPFYGERNLQGNDFPQSYDYLIYATNLSDNQLVISDQSVKQK